VTNSKDRLSPSKEKDLRNQEIYLEIASGIKKDVICKKWGLSITQLNRILRDGNKEAEEWYKSLPRRTMIQIFFCNGAKTLEEIQKLEHIRDKVRDEPKLEFDMTKSIIDAYYQYTRMMFEGPAIRRQKEVIEAAEKVLSNKN